MRVAGVRSRHHVRLGVYGAVVIAVCAVGVVRATTPTAPDRLPSPLSGPGVPTIKKSQHKKISRAWNELLSGNVGGALKRLSRAGDSIPASLLDVQIRLLQGDGEVVEELRHITDGHPGYAAAWITRSVAAAEMGAEAEAIRSAERGADLWPDSPWAARPGELRRTWIDDRVRLGDDLLAEGRDEDAWKAYSAARNLDPENPEAALGLARIHLADDRLDEAEPLLAIAGDLPDAVFLRGRIAERREDWHAAMEHYSQLPINDPRRDTALNRAKIKWRLTLLPPYAREAMTAEPPDRGDLAVILVSVYPRLETLPGDAVPVMSDIVDHPGHREIITVVRLGIMTADRRDHRFYPDRPADPATIREAVDRTRALLGLPARVWCGDRDVVGSECTSLSPPISGGAVVRAVLDLTPGVIE